ncbi:MAG TPA: shikimate kinase [Chloroflexia bacterium]
MIESPPNLVLGGFMGTGKSTVGKLLAARLQRPFVDTDDLIKRRAGMSIAQMFELHGEPYFRGVERQVCLDVASERGQVVATGGGALLDAASREAFETGGVIVLLTCERNALLARLEESARLGTRPLIGDDFAAQVDRLLAAREQVYSSFPLHVDTTNLGPNEVAEHVLALYHEAIERGVAACKP